MICIVQTQITAFIVALVGSQGNAIGVIRAIRTNGKWADVMNVILISTNAVVTAFVSFVVVVILLGTCLVHVSGRSINARLSGARIVAPV